MIVTLHQCSKRTQYNTQTNVLPKLVLSFCLIWKRSNTISIHLLKKGTNYFYKSKTWTLATENQLGLFFSPYVKFKTGRFEIFQSPFKGLHWGPGCYTAYKVWSCLLVEHARKLKDTLKHDTGVDLQVFLFHMVICYSLLGSREQRQGTTYY